MSRIKHLIAAFPGRRYAEGGQVEPDSLGSDPSMQGSGPDASGGIVPLDYDPMNPAGDPSYSANAAKERRVAGAIADKYIVQPFTAAHDVMEGTRDPYEAADSMQSLISLGNAPGMTRPGFGMLGGRGEGGGRAPRELDPHGFYSKALEEAKGLQMQKGTVQQFTNALTKAGVKKTELEATGWNQLDPNRPMTRADVEQHFRDNRVGFDVSRKAYNIAPDDVRQRWEQAQENLIHANREYNIASERGSWEQQEAAWENYQRARDDHQAAENHFMTFSTPYEQQPQYGNYTTKSKAEGKPLNDTTSYSESVFHYPPKETMLSADEVHEQALHDFANDPFVQPSQQGVDIARNNPRGNLIPEIRNVLRRGGVDLDHLEYNDDLPDMVNRDGKDYYVGKQSTIFKSSHWEEPNTFLHTRQTDRDIPGFGKSHYIEEIQSDWGQKGRDKGFVGEGDEINRNIRDARQTYRSAGDALDDYRNRAMEDPQWEARNDPEYQRLADIYSSAYDHYAGLTEKRAMDPRTYTVPKAPLLDTGEYTELGLKKAFIDAARNDADSVTLAPPMEHTLRYVYPAEQHGIDQSVTQKMERGYNSYYGDRAPKAMKKVAQMVDPKAQVEPYEFNAGPVRAREDRDIPYGDPNLARIVGMTEEYGDPANHLNFVKGPGVKLTPEMKERIKTDGFPLFMRGGLPPLMSLDPAQDPYARAELARGGSVDKDDSPDPRQRWKERREGLPEKSIIDSSAGAAYPYLAPEDMIENMPVMEDLTRAPRPYAKGGEVESKAKATVPLRWQSAPDHPETHLAYITDAEHALLKQLDLHNSGVDKEDHFGPKGIYSLDGAGDDSGYGGGPNSGYSSGVGSISAGGFTSPGSGGYGTTLGNSGTFGGSGGSMPGSNSSGYSSAGIGGGGGFTGTNGGYGPSNTVGNSSTFGGSGAGLGSTRTGSAVGSGGSYSSNFGGDYGSGVAYGGGYAPVDYARQVANASALRSLQNANSASSPQPASLYTGSGLVGATQPQQAAPAPAAPAPAQASGFSFTPPGGLVSAATADVAPAATIKSVGSTGDADRSPAASVASQVSFGPGQVSTTTETNPVGLRSEISKAEDAYNAAAREHGMLDSTENEYQNPYSTVHKMVQIESGWDDTPSLKLRGVYGAPQPSDYVNGTLSAQLDPGAPNKWQGFTNASGYSGLSQIGKAFNSDNNPMVGQPGQWSVESQAEAALTGMEKNAKELEARLGRPVTGADLYGAHNLGVSGYANALNNPDRGLTADMRNNPAFARGASTQGEYAANMQKSFGQTGEMATDFSQRDIAPLAPADRPPGLVPGGYLQQRSDVEAPAAGVQALYQDPSARIQVASFDPAADMARRMGYDENGNYVGRPVQGDLADEGIQTKKVPTLSINPTTPDVTQPPSFVRELLAGPGQYGIEPGDFSIKPGIGVGDMGSPHPYATNITGSLPSFVSQALAGPANTVGLPSMTGGTNDVASSPDIGGRRPLPSTYVGTPRVASADLNGPSTRTITGDQISPLEGTSNLDRQILSTMPTVANVVLPILAGPFAPLIMAANLGSYALTGKSLFTHMAENPGDITALGLDGSGKLNGSSQAVLQQLASAAPPRTQPTAPTTPTGETLTLPPSFARTYIPLTDYENYGQGPAHDFYRES